MTPVPSSTVHDPAEAAAQPTPPPPNPSAVHDPMGVTPPAPTSAMSAPRSVHDLPAGALDFAARMFDMARRGDLQLVAYLEAGLPPNLTNSRGDSLLMLAAYHGHAPLVRAMLEARLPPDPTATATGAGAGAPHDEDDDDARVPPTSSPTTRPPPPGGHRRFVDVNQLNARGQSCVAGAIFKDHSEVVELLLRHGADPLAGRPNAEECARMFKRWDDEYDDDDGSQGEAVADGQAATGRTGRRIRRKGYGSLLEGASGRGSGATEAAEAVEDREEVRRVPGVGEVRAPDA